MSQCATQVRLKECPVISQAAAQADDIKNVIFGWDACNVASPLTDTSQMILLQGKVAEQ